MADPIVLLALALLAGAPLALAPTPTLAAAAAITLVLRGRVARGAWVVATAALIVGGLRARAALAHATVVHERAVAMLMPPLRCEGEATVVSSPIVVGRAAAGRSLAEGQARIDVEITTGLCGDRPIGAPFRARLYGAPEDVGRGDRLAVLADLAPVHLFANPDLPDPRPGIARSGVAASGGAVEIRVLDRAHGLGALVDRARRRVRARIEATFHPEASPLGRALVLGESDLDPTDDEAFRVSGLSHLLAVSGTHLVIAVLGFTAALRALFVRVERIAARVDATRLAAACAVPAACLYADFAGGSGSAVRAAAMLGAAMIARAIGRHGSGVRAFACSIAVLATWDPLLLCDVSFALSAGATAGLVVLQPPIKDAIARGPGPLPALLGPIATTLAAMIGCAPVLTILSPTLPLLGILANLVAAPIGEICALPICLGHAVLFWSPALERGAALLGSGALLGVRAVARWSAALDATIAIPPPTPWQLAVIAAVAVAMWAAADRRRRITALLAGAALWGAFEIAAQRAGSPHDLLRISVLDVGQGDALLVDLPDGSAMLIDGGGMVGSPVDLGARVIQPVLRARRRTRLQAMVLSHPHPDHFGGLASTMPKISVGELWDSGQGEDQGAGPGYAALLSSARAKGVMIQRPADLCGKPRTAGGATIEVLSPCPGYAPDAGANDNSLVLKLSYGKRAALLVGDAEHEEERTLVARFGASLKADLLKVGHHGSRTSSSPPFLAAVRPSAAAISAGVRNRFGHPHPRTLAALEERRIEALRTDRGGAIVWETDGEEVRVSRP
ncbi:DNA internalization-related competence protein ComEC/Rec2 [Minicystis rosea]|nr:DNA internalization-related competence protein ComEC/Rec2 [Minicystis rosea]